MSLPANLREVSTSILIVDDQQLMIDVVSEIFKRLGFVNIAHATSGETALARLRETRCDLIISDLNMEPMTGLELLRAVRRDDELKDIPFLLMTASMDTANVMAAKRAGVTTYLVKPFTPSALRRKIQAAFRNVPRTRLASGPSNDIEDGSTAIGPSAKRWYDYRS